MTREEKYLREALLEARKAYEEDEVPIGCVIVLNDEIIARAHNHKEQNKDPLSHAEIEAIRIAVSKINSRYLNDCELYVTLEPCLMCAGAISHSRLKRVIFGASDPKTGSIKSNLNYLEYKGINHHPDVIAGVMEEESSCILKEFFVRKRALKSNK